MSYLPLIILYLLTVAHTLIFKHCGFLPAPVRALLHWDGSELPQTTLGESAAINAFRGQHFQVEKYNHTIMDGICVEWSSEGVCPILTPCVRDTQSAQDVWVKARLIPKDGGTTASLGHVLPSHCSGAAVSTCLIRGPWVAEVAVGTCPFIGHLWEGLALHSLSTSHTVEDTPRALFIVSLLGWRRPSPYMPHAPGW